MNKKHFIAIFSTVYSIETVAGYIITQKTEDEFDKEKMKRKIVKKAKDANSDREVKIFWGEFEYNVNYTKDDEEKIYLDYKIKAYCANPEDNFFITKRTTTIEMS